MYVDPKMETRLASDESNLLFTYHGDGKGVNTVFRSLEGKKALLPFLGNACNSLLKQEILLMHFPLLRVFPVFLSSRKTMRYGMRGISMKCGQTGFVYPQHPLRKPPALRKPVSIQVIARGIVFKSQFLAGCRDHMGNHGDNVP
jgi:hypothetical protein